MTMIRKAITSLFLLLFCLQSQAATFIEYWDATSPSGADLRDENAGDPRTHYDLGTPSDVAQYDDQSGSLVYTTHLVIPFTFSSVDFASGTPITDAQLRLYLYSPRGTDATVAVSTYARSSMDSPTWLEHDSIAEATWVASATLDNDAHLDPSDATTLTSIDVNYGGSYSVYTVDVASLFPSTWTDQDLNLDFIIAADTSLTGVFQGVYLKTDTTDSRRPQIWVTHAGATPTPTITPASTPTPTPTMSEEDADELGLRIQNYPAIMHGPLLIESGMAILPDDGGPEDSVFVIDREGNSTHNYLNLIDDPGFDFGISDWVANASATIVEDSTTVYYSGDSSSLKVISSAANGAASSTISHSAMNDGRMVASVVSKVTEQVDFLIRAHYANSIASKSITQSTSTSEPWQVHSLSFAVDAGESVTAIEVLLVNSGKTILIDNVGLYDSQFYQGYVSGRSVLTENLNVSGTLTAASVSVTGAFITDTTFAEDIVASGSLTVGGSVTLQDLASGPVGAGGTGILSACNNLDIDYTDLTVSAPITKTGSDIGLDESSVDHGSLDGLTDDDHTGYVRGSGRSGGQTVQGGTGAGEDLSLESTSNASKGVIDVLDTIQGAGDTNLQISWDTGNDEIQIGTSGSPEGIILEPGNKRVGIGTNTPLYPLHIHENSAGANYFTMTNTDTGTTTGDGLQVGFNSGETVTIINRENTDTWLYNADASIIKFWTDATLRGEFQGDGDFSLDSEKFLYDNTNDQTDANELRTGFLIPSQLTANQTAYDMGTSHTYLLSADGDYELQGIAAEGEGTLHVIYWNDSGNDLTIKHENAGATAADRITTASSDDLTLTQGRSVWLQYLASRWRVIADHR